MPIDEKAAEAVFQQFKHVKPRLNKAAIELLCTAYEAAKATDQPVGILSEPFEEGSQAIMSVQTTEGQMPVNDLRLAGAIKSESAPDECRAAFMKWASRNDRYVYCDPVTTVKVWMGWQAAWDARDTKRGYGTRYQDALAELWDDSQKAALPFNTREAPRESLVGYEIDAFHLLQRFLSLACRASHEAKEQGRRGTDE